MKPFSLALLVFLSIGKLFSQTNNPKINIKGIVSDSSNGKPMAYVTIALLDVQTKAPIKSTLSKEDGSFEITAPAAKQYELALAFTGYNNKQIPLKEDTNINLGKILMSVLSKELKGVTVTALRPVMKRQIDGITYDVTADPESVALSALDMMRKVPLLTLDASDNIKLKGSGNYKILVNGKESALVAKNPSDVLRAMPATNIERIEVITTPPAKYDAEGLVGIINIITKKNADQGYNVGVNARYSTIWSPGINLNGTLKQGKFGLAAYAGYNVHNTHTNAFGNTQNFFADNSSVSQTGTNTFGGHHTYGDAELSYEIDSLNLLTGSFEIYSGNNNQNSNQLSTTLAGNGALLQQYNLMNSGYNNYVGLDASVNYQLGFKKDKNRLLTLSYKYSYSPFKQFNNNSFSDTLQFEQPAYQQYNDAGNKEHTIQIDYAHPFKKLTLEAGAKAILRDNFSDFQTTDFNDTTNKYVLNQAQTNDFHYYQDIYSLYNSYQYKMDKWVAKAGLRIERTTVDANFITVGSSIQTAYNNLIPSLSIQRNFKSSTINFGYTDRISRPGIYQLNPFVDQSNPKFISKGNPNLVPELNHTFELNYSNFSKASINIGLSYAFSTNSIQNVTNLQVDSAAGKIIDTVTLTTFQNLGSNKTLGINFNTSFTIIKNLTFSLNGQLSYLWLKGNFDGQTYSNAGFTGNAFMNIGYKFGKEFRIGLDAGFFSGDVNLQGHNSGYLFNSYVLSKTLLKKKLTLSLVANNPYSKVFTSKSHTTTKDFYQYSFNQNPYRNFAIRINYKFGKLNSDIKRNQHGINNDDTKAGKSGGASQ